MNLTLIAVRKQSRTLNAPNFPLAFSTDLAKARLSTVVSEQDAFPVFAVTSDSRAIQVAATDRLREIIHSAEEEGTPSLASCALFSQAGLTLLSTELPMVYVYSALQEFIQQLEEEEESTHLAEIRRASTQESNTVVPRPVRLKSALLWSHHLLATSKRKDIQHWSTELNVWAVAKIGLAGSYSSFAQPC